MGMFSASKPKKPPTTAAPGSAPSSGSSADDGSPSSTGKHVAVVGSGIAGLSAAYLAHRNGHKVTLFEAGAKCGGHALTVGSSVGPVDLGFQVFNLTTYPHLVGLFAELGVQSEKSDMSFALSTSEVEWGSLGLGAVFAQKGNLVRPKFLNMIREILRFGREAPRVLLPENEAKYQDVDLGTYLKTNGYSKFFAENYVVPMCAAIWSCSDQDTHKFPIRTLITFWVNHHLLNVVQRPVWRVVKGRSAAYVDAVVAALPEGSVRVNAPVVEVITDPTGNAKVSVKYTQGAKDIIETFDDVIMACHSDQALALLKDSGIDSETKAALTRIRYQPNDVYLHTDKSLMPANRHAWASWNCLKGTRGGDDVQRTNGSLDDPAETNDNDNHNENSQSVCVTYWVNLLQNLPKHAPDVFVTLNPPRPPREGTAQHKVTLAHPLFDKAAIDAQKTIQKKNGKHHVYFAGAWCGYGFHEDGIKSAVDALTAMATMNGSVDGGNETTKTKTKSVTPWKPRSCDPRVSWTDKLCVPLFKRVAGSWVPPGRTFRMLLPNGDELVMTGKKAKKTTSEDGEKPELGMDGLPVVKEVVMRVWDNALFVNAVTRADIGLGESYMNGDFSFESGTLYDLLDLFCAGHPANVGSAVGQDSGVPSLGKDIVGLLSEALRRIGGAVEFAAHAALSNTKEGSKRNIEYHYDAGNSFYELFLDKTMLYSSGIHGPYLNGEACTVGTALSKIDVNDFQKREEHLEQAQYAKIDAMIDRLGLPLTDPVSVLEIGCGWGALAIRLCQRFPNANVTGLTLSNEQHAEATKRVARAGLTNQIEIVIRDYRDVSDVYDAVISIEMLEAVGHEHLPSYFGTVSKALKLGGVCAIQVITMPNARYKSYCQSESDFIRAYIFPGGHLPSIGAMEGAANCVGLKLDSYLDIGNHYAVTLRLWRERMMANAPKITGELGYSEKFLRMFEFYFAYCEAGFARGLINDLQMTWVKHEGGSGGIDRKHQSTRLTDAIEKSARNSRRVSIAALSGYVFWILNEDVSRNFQPHVFGIVKGTAAIVLVHFFVTVCAAGATAATGGKAGKAGKGLNLKSSVQTASPVAALVIATTVAFLVTRSVFELGCDEKTFNLLFVNGRWVNSVGGSIRTVAKAVLECVLTVETPVTEYASASLVAVASASAAVTRLLAAAVGADASSSGSSTPGVTRSERDQKRSFVARVVDSLVLFACVLALRQGMGLNAVLVFSLAWIARVGANVSEIAKKSSGYPSRDPRRLLRTVFAFAAGAGFVVARVVPHLFLMTATAMNGYWVVRDVATAAAQSLLYAFESGNFDARAVSIAVFQNASSAVSASGALSACVAVSATGALILDFGAVSHSTRLRTAEKAVRERIIRLSTSADV